MNRSNGWLRSSLPKLTLIAISQTLVMLRNTSLVGSSISVRAWELRDGLSSTNQMKLWVSSRRFTPYSPESHRVAHQNHRLCGSCPWHSQVAAAAWYV